MDPREKHRVRRAAGVLFFFLGWILHKDARWNG